MAKYLVTGGAGFIGSHLVKELVKKGHQVKIIDNLSTGKIKNLEEISSKVKFVKGDIRNSKMLEKEFRGADFVLHQAARSSVPESMKSPQIYHQININGTFNVLEAAAKNKVKKVVFASSSAVYGEPARFPIKEKFLPSPLSPYALTKLAGEDYGRIFAKYWHLPTIALRYFNVFGPGQRVGDEYAVVIPKFIDCFLNNQPPPVFGTGKQSRDYIYVDNIVSANLLGATSEVDFGIYNVGSGEDLTILEMIKLLNKISGKNLQPKFLPERAGDIFRSQADISKIKKDLGFKIKVDFATGLKRTYEWAKGEIDNYLKIR